MKAKCRVGDLVTDLAYDIWRGQRSAVGFGLSGLSSPSVVRARLLVNAAKLAEEGRLRAGTRAVLELVDFETENDRGVRDKCEAALRSQLRPRFDSVDSLIAACDRVGVALLRVLVVQSIAARLGHWAPRQEELGDARTARLLCSHLPPPAWNRYGGLIQEAGDSFHAGRWREAAAAYIDADRMVRTATGLLRASVAMVHSQQHVAALWTVRASLLEPEVAFETPGAHAQARRLAKQLEVLLEARQQADLDSGEVRMLNSAAVAATAEEMAMKLSASDVVSSTRPEPSRTAIPRRIKKRPSSTRRVVLSPPLDALRSDQLSAKRPSSVHGEPIRALSLLDGPEGGVVFGTDRIDASEPAAALEQPCALRTVTGEKPEATQERVPAMDHSFSTRDEVRSEDLLAEPDSTEQAALVHDTLTAPPGAFDWARRAPSDSTPVPFAREDSELADEVFDTIEDDIDPTVPLVDHRPSQVPGAPPSVFDATPEVFPFAALIEEARHSNPEALQAITRNVSASPPSSEFDVDLRARPALSTPRGKMGSQESALERKSTRPLDLEAAESRIDSAAGMDFSDILVAEEIDFDASTDLSLDTLSASESAMLPLSSFSLDFDSESSLASLDEPPFEDIPSVEIRVVEESPTPPPTSTRPLGQVRYVPEPTPAPPPRPPSDMAPRAPLTRLIVRDKVRASSAIQQKAPGALAMRRIRPLPDDDPKTETELSPSNVIPFPRAGSPSRPMLYERIDEDTQSSIVDARGFVDVDTGQVEAVMRMMSQPEGRDAAGSVSPDQPAPLPRRPAPRAAKSSLRTEPFVLRNLLDLLVVYALPVMPRATVELALAPLTSEEVASSEIVFERRASSVRVVPLPDGVAPHGLLIEVRQPAATTANLAAELIYDERLN